MSYVDIYTIILYHYYPNTMGMMHLKIMLLYFYGLGSAVRFQFMLVAVREHKIGINVFISW